MSEEMSIANGKKRSVCQSGFSSGDVWFNGPWTESALVVLTPRHLMSRSDGWHIKLWKLNSGQRRPANSGAVNSGQHCGH